MREFLVTAPYGLAELLGTELEQIGIPDAVSSAAGVTFSAALEDGYRVALWSRVANRVLVKIASFPADSETALYEGVRDVAWEDHLGNDDTLAVTFASKRGVITHTQYGSQKVKDGIVDRFRDRTGSRPSVDRERPDVRIHVALIDQTATVFIDLSGPLHQRGYRVKSVEAPIKENVAAAILLRTRWPEAAKAGAPLVDPMCGSGTFLIEGAWIAQNRAPGLLRKHWPLLGWKQHDAAAWKRVMDDALQTREVAPMIRGTDIDCRAVAATLANVEAAGLHGVVHAEKNALSQVSAPPMKPDDPKGVVIVNPPYGERMEAGEQASLREQYTKLGLVLKQEFAGWDAYVLTGDEELGKTMGLRAARRHKFYNGAIKCTLLYLPIHSEGGEQPAPTEKTATSDAGSDMLRNRLNKRIKQLKGWRKQNAVSCYRLYDADLPEYAAAIDVYEDYAVVQEYNPPEEINARKALKRLEHIEAVTAEVLSLEPDHVIRRQRRRTRGTSQYEKQDSAQLEVKVHEANLQFWINLSDYLDTGLFLDHRRTRAMIRDLANGKSFLNLFAYTGSATVFAAAGGAKSTTTVDMSRPYLDWAKRNLALNGLAGKRHLFEQANCLSWIARTHERYDLIFLDPPTFSNSKRMEDSFDIQRDHVDLIQRTARLLNPGGTLLFSTNARSFKLDQAALSDLKIEDITKQTTSRDFERARTRHRCFRITG